MLRPGNAATATGADGLLKRLIVLLRQAFPGARLRVRLDGGFARRRLLDDLDDRSAWNMSSRWPKTRCSRAMPSR